MNGPEIFATVTIGLSALLIFSHEAKSVFMWNYIDGAIDALAMVGDVIAEILSPHKLDKETIHLGCVGPKQIDFNKENKTKRIRKWVGRT